MDPGALHRWQIQFRLRKVDSQVAGTENGHGGVRRLCNIICQVDCASLLRHNWTQCISGLFLQQKITFPKKWWNSKSWRRLDIKMMSYQYRDSHFGVNMISRHCCVHNGNSMPGDSVTIFILKWGPWPGPSCPFTDHCDQLNVAWTTETQGHHIVL